MSLQLYHLVLLYHKTIKKDTQMKKALLINGYETYEGVGENRLNRSLIEYTKEILEKKGYVVSVTVVEEGYESKEEHDKILESDVVFVQTPIYWFGIPGAFKSYLDRVFLIGYGIGTFSKGDGRTREDATKKYGSGGLLTDKKYMVSTTSNAPESAFNDENEFMDGLSLDKSMATLHKSFEFCGLQKLPSIGIYDVFKEADRTEDIQNFKAHIEKNF